MTTFFSFRRTLPVLLFCGTALLAANGYPGQTLEVPTAAVSSPEDLALTSGQSLERELRAGELKSFVLRLNAGTFLALEMFSRDLNLSCRLLGPDGKEIAKGSELLAAKVDRDGFYRLELAANATKMLGRFSVRVLDLRPGRSEDEPRVLGATLLSKAQELSEQDGETRKRAESLAMEALDAWQRANDPRGELAVLLFRGGVRFRQGDMPGALEWYGKAMKRARETGLMKEEARSLASMGLCRGNQGNYPEAIEIYQQAQKIWDEVGGPSDRASIRHYLAKGYMDKGDYEAAGKIYQEEFSIVEASGDLIQQARALAGLGAVQYFLYEIEQARELWERALPLSRQVGDQDNEGTLEQNLAVLYLNQGQLQKALDAYVRLGLQVSPENAALMHYNTGLVYLEMGNLDKALESFELSRAAASKVGNANERVRAMIGIGRVLQRKGSPQSALAEYQKAQGIFPEERWDVLYSVGMASMDLGLSQKALGFLEKALALAEAVPDRSQEIITNLALGLARAALGQRDAARANLDQAIAVGKQIGYNAVIAPALLRRALLARDEKHFESALADVEGALKVVETTRRNIADDQLRLGFFATKRTYYDLDVDLLLKLDRAHPDKDQYRTLAFEASERSKARGLLDLLAEGRIDLSQGIDPDLRSRDARLSSELSRVQRNVLAQTDPEKIKPLAAEVKNLEAQRQQLDQEIRTRNPRYAEIRYPVPLRLQEIRERILDDKTALLEYSLGTERSDLFVVTRKQIVVYPLPPAREIAEKVRGFREGLERESLATRREYLDLASQLHQDLIAPASGVLKEYPNLLIVPDGALYYVPFEALLTEPANGRSYRDLPYLLRSHSIVYIPSASVLSGLREPRQEQAQGPHQEIALFAPFASSAKVEAHPGTTRAATSGMDVFQRFKPLPASLREISEISSLYPGETLKLIGRAASENAFKKDPGIATAGRLHLATHAQINEEKPELSALIFSPGAGEDGYLDVREIFNLKLSAHLAVLSACETGLGKEVTGEGLIGLTRAFFYAGVPSVVVSLWNVVDGSTPDLMRNFYKDMDQLGNKATALQNAKLAMISQGKFAYPTYWAPFILLGEPR